MQKVDKDTSFVMKNNCQKIDYVGYHDYIFNKIVNTVTCIYCHSTHYHKENEYYNNKEVFIKKSDCVCMILRYYSIWKNEKFSFGSS